MVSGIKPRQNAQVLKVQLSSAVEGTTVEDFINQVKRHNAYASCFAVRRFIGSKNRN